jgi:hypothetical protein
MKVSKQHITYAFRVPFMSVNGTLDDLFARLDKYDAVERMHCLYLTCCAFGIDVPLIYWTDDELCEEMYKEFKQRCYLLAKTMHDFMITHIVVQITLTVLWERCNPVFQKERVVRLKQTIGNFRDAMIAGSLDRVTGAAVVRHLEAFSENDMRVSYQRYAMFCQRVVAYLL